MEGLFNLKCRLFKILFTENNSLPRRFSARRCRNTISCFVSVVFAFVPKLNETSKQLDAASMT